MKNSFYFFSHKDTQSGWHPQPKKALRAIFRRTYWCAGASIAKILAKKTRIRQKVPQRNTKVYHDVILHEMYLCFNPILVPHDVAAAPGDI